MAWRWLLSFWGARRGAESGPSRWLRFTTNQGRGGAEALFDVAVGDRQNEERHRHGLVSVRQTVSHSVTPTDRASGLPACHHSRGRAHLSPRAIFWGRDMSAQSSISPAVKWHACHLPWHARSFDSPVISSANAGHVSPQRAGGHGSMHLNIWAVGYYPQGIYLHRQLWVWLFFSRLCNSKHISYSMNKDIQ